MMIDTLTTGELLYDALDDVGEIENATGLELNSLKEILKRLSRDYINRNEH